MGPMPPLQLPGYGGASLLSLKPGNLIDDLLRTQSDAAPPQDSFSASEGQPTTEDTFEAITYGAASQRISLSAKLEEFMAQYTRGEGDEASTSQISAQQMSFEFVAESRVEELTRFSEQSQRVSDGLSGPQQSRFTAVSQRVSFSFQMSMSISGEALQGFGNSAEGLMNLDDMFGQMMDMAEKSLDTAESLFNDFFSFMNSGAKEGDTGALSFNEMMNRTVAAILKNEYLSQPGMESLPEGETGAEAPAPTPAQNTSGTQGTFQQMELNFSFSAEFTQVEVVQESDPIVLDLDDDGIELSHYSQGARFDIRGTGSYQNTAFVRGGDAFLALDRNQDGIINSGKELFGDQHGAKNGFEELRKLDSNHDGIIDRNDKKFDLLKVFRDNGNGRTEAGELFSLAEAGIASLDLDYTDVDQGTAGGNRLAQIAQFRRTDGSLGRAADAILNYTA